MKILPSDYVIDKYGLKARLVNEADSEYILALRTGSHTKYMHTVDADLEKQNQWTREYKIREAAGLDYYFIFYKENEPIGLNRIYEIRGDVFSTGSWTFGSNAPFGSAFLAQIILREIAFFDLGLRYEDDPIGVHVENKSVLNYNFMAGLKDTGRVTIEEGEYVSLGLTKEDFINGRSKILRMLRIKEENI